MKKTLLVLPCVAVSFFINAQTIIFEDNFDSYTAGLGVAEQSSSWTTWDGSPGLDGAVSSSFAFSGANSAKIEGTNVDLVLPTGPYESGKYDLKFKMYLTEAGGYFNVLHKWSADNTNYEWACDIFFDTDGTVTWVAGGLDTGSSLVALNEWFDVMVSADMDADEGRLYLNGVMVNQWQWSLIHNTGLPGVNAMVAVDFYGTNTSSGNGLYYIDDVQLVESTGVNTNEIAVKAVPTFYPNPANDMLNINLPANEKSGVVTITDMTGQIALTQNLNGNFSSLEIGRFSKGVYFVRVECGDSIMIEKLIIE